MKLRHVPNPTNVRFDDETKSQLVSIAKTYGITASELVRVAVISKIPEWKAEGVIRMPRLDAMSGG
jgi:hypothetical protein